MLSNHFHLRNNSDFENMASCSNLEGRNSIDVQSQREIIKFMFLEGSSVAETHRRLMKVMASNAFSKTTVQDWFRKFNNSDWDVKEHRGEDRSSALERDTRIDAVKEAFEHSRSWSMSSLSDNLGIPVNLSRYCGVQTRIRETECKMGTS